MKVQPSTSPGKLGLLDTPFSIITVSHRPHLVQGLRDSLSPLPVTRIDGTGARSCSWLWNQAIVQSPTEIVIIANDKSRPTQADVEKMLRLIAEGFALVGLGRFNFFGFPKETIRRIGFFDERFKGGGFEDNDMSIRLREANLAFYESPEVSYLPIPSGWNYAVTKVHYDSKWRVEPGEPKTFVRLLPEWKPDYDLGPSVPRRFLPWEKSHLTGYYISLEDKVSEAPGGAAAKAYLRARALVRSYRLGSLHLRAYASLPAPVRSVIKKFWPAGLWTRTKTPSDGGR